uniref:Transposase n=1 Tax=Fervidicoccus fontis TaxID=683846 RepID=A0A7J3SLE6_9CREN
MLTFFPASFRESAEVWKEVLADLKERGLKEPLLFMGDGLKGLPHAVKEIYPKADFQSCLLEKMRQSLAKVRKRDQELQPFIYSTNALERFQKEVKRRAKMIESFSQPEGEEKVLLMVTEQMNESYRKRILPNWHISKPALEKMRKEKYGTEVRSEEAPVEV